MTNRKEMAKQLKRIREVRGLKIVDAARRTGLTHATIIRYENGSIQPNITNAIRLAEAYQMSLDDIFMPKGVTKQSQ